MRGILLTEFIYALEPESEPAWVSPAKQKKINLLLISFFLLSSVEYAEVKTETCMIWEKVHEHKI